MFLDRQGQYDGRPECEKLMQDCGLTYRKGKNYIDVLKATNRNFSTDKSIHAWLENAAERIDSIQRATPKHEPIAQVRSSVSPITGPPVIGHINHITVEWNNTQNRRTVQKDVIDDIIS